MAIVIGQNDVFQDSQSKVQDLSLIVKQKIATLHSDLKKLQDLRDAQQSWNSKTPSQVLSVLLSY